MAKKFLCVIAFMLALVCVLASCGGNNQPEHTHAYGEWETTKSATCTTEGSKERYCSCGEKQTVTIAVKEHEYGEWSVSKEPTFTENGEETRSCACGNTETRDIAKRESFIDRLNSRNYRVNECDEYFANDFELCYNLDINNYNIIEALDVCVDDDFGAWMLTIIKCDSVSTAKRLAEDLEPSFDTIEDKIVVIDTYVFFGNADAIDDAIGE